MPLTLSSSASGPPPVSLLRPRHRYRFANVEFDEARHCLSVDGRPVDLEPRPRQLLLMLLRHPDQALSKEELLRQVWGNRPTVDNVLPSAVRKLRHALGHDAATRIVTLPRIGYRFDGPVARLDSDSDDIDAADREPEPPPVTPALAAITPGWAPEPDLGVRSEGQDLLSWAAEQDRLSTLPTGERQQLLLQLATALAQAHNLGVLHRDVHPRHVRIAGSAGDWRASLVGFAAPSPRPARDHRPMAAASIYTAPEVLAGQPATAQADLFALGTLGRQLLSGDLCAAQPTGAPAPLADEGLALAIEAATAPDPAHRPGSVAQWLQQLVHAQAQERTIGWHPTPAAWRLQRRHAVGAALGLLILLVISLEALP